MASLSDVARTLRTAADALPLTLLAEAADAAQAAATLLAHTTVGTSDPEIIATTDTFAEAYRRCTELLQTAQALHTHINTLADRLAPDTTPPPPPAHVEPGRIEQNRRSLPVRPEGTETQGRWLRSNGDTVVVRSGPDDEWHDHALDFVRRMTGTSKHPASRLAVHVEVKLAMRMRHGRLTEETVVIDRTVCGRRPTDRQAQYTCDKFLKHFLPRGARLTVVERDGTRVVYEGEG
ncbi:hypothetical protein GCM10022243_07450 [Saccharothrix violaceirubra]|uniref:SCP1.201-like deaminase n=1 Tax=Saccharothrix violaceirubra TaxID=413306 RepID=A0A7W7SYC0_9PSEU|nr:DddA-like double-stranded DNA deaminase toxin [Saccharothrix violaceirubra]MBB4963158.1 hypothetical protein [Saccharothrix violaceirubra]